LYPEEMSSRRARQTISGSAQIYDKLVSQDELMSKSITLDLAEAEAARLDQLLDEMLATLRRSEETGAIRQARIEQLRAETHVLLDQIESQLLRF
jgi:hypothetical protein